LAAKGAVAVKSGGCDGCGGCGGCEECGDLSQETVVAWWTNRFRYALILLKFNNFAMKFMRPSGVSAPFDAIPFHSIRFASGKRLTNHLYHLWASNQPEIVCPNGTECLDFLKVASIKMVWKIGIFK